MRNFIINILSLCLIVSTALFIGTACNQVKFKINFVVDDEVYATIDTSGQEIIQMPENPTKENLIFDGWYWDKDMWKLPFTANSLLDAPLSSDMRVYAKFKSNHGCNFNQQVISEYYKKSDATCEDKAIYFVSCSCGERGTQTFECGEPLGHSYTNYVTGADGSKTAICDRDGCNKMDTIQANSFGFIKSYSVTNRNVYTKVVSNTETVYFPEVVVLNGNASYKVYKDINCENELKGKEFVLENFGENKCYILATVNNVDTLYHVTIYRRSVFAVNFITNNGTTIPTQYIEEDSLVQKPVDLERVGYTFNGYNFNFSTPITQNTTIRALWTAKTDTPYKVEYYLENIEDTNYTKVETVNKIGITDTIANAVIKNYEHFTAESYNVRNYIKGDGSTVLKVYYKRNKYTVSNANSDLGTITCEGSYKYGTKLTLTASVNLGYDFGWYNDYELISQNTNYTFEIDKNITAKIALDPALTNFKFTSTANTCEITGVIDKNITSVTIPNYVTIIGSYAFSNCGSLTSIEIPNSVTIIGSYAFKSCDGLTSIEIPNSVTSIGMYAFAYCDNLTSILIPNSVTSIGEVAFYDCDSLTSIEMPNSVTSIGSSAFHNCTNLKYNIEGNLKYLGNKTNKYLCLISVTSTDITTATINENCKTIAYGIFASCTKLASITVDSKNIVYKSINGNVYSKDGKTLVQ